MLSKKLSTNFTLTIYTVSFISFHIMKQHWKFLLLGITGDLSYKKILPGIAQFASLHQQEVDIELYGYSRSVPNNEEIRSILTSNGADETVLPILSYTQGDYGDNSFFHELIGTLKEGQRLVVYLAVPPSVFLKFLQNSCPYSNKPIDILIEKPFGTSATEAKHILNVVSACDLHQNVHFCDHYLFKNGTFLPEDAKAQLAQLNPDNLTSIIVKALETVSVEGRLGYYNDTGALKDMLPHLYSLTQLFIDQLGQPQHSSVPGQPTVLEFTQGQYENYLTDLNIPESSTETYFSTTIEQQLDQKNSVQIRYESGKKLASKVTSIQASFTDGHSVYWEIQPHSHIVITSSQSESEEKSISFPLPDFNILDHTRTFEMLLHANNQRFVSIQNITRSWELYEAAESFKKENQPSILTPRYIEGQYPLHWVV